MTYAELIIEQVGNELDSAQRQHPPLRSIHEAYAVVLEELDEFWQEAKKKDRSLQNLHREMVQVAAMAIRTCVDVL